MTGCGSPDLPFRGPSFPIRYEEDFCSKLRGCGKGFPLPLSSPRLRSWPVQEKHVLWFCKLTPRVERRGQRGSGGNRWACCGAGCHPGKFFGASRRNSGFLGKRA
ncbi:hypothetical protein MUG91_G5n30 [Manis pentadactyla]|nr:hypothetical protein MUG91_G5n30 [Manis pentadactyla]